MASRKRKILSLEERIKVIERSEKGMETAKSIRESWCWKDTDPEHFF